MTQALIDSIEANQKTAAALSGKLRRSLVLQDLWPGVFTHGRAHSWFRGNLYQPLDMVFVIEDGAGERRKFPVDQAPNLIFLPFAEKMLTNAPREFIMYTQKRKRAAT